MSTPKPPQTLATIHATWPLPWTGTGDNVCDASGCLIAEVDPYSDSEADDRTGLAQFFASAPETALRLEEMVAAAEGALWQLDHPAIVPSLEGQDDICRLQAHADVTALRAAIARARGGAS